MEREILFRGKRIDNGEWIWGGYFTSDSLYFICNEDETAQVDPESVGQFTGLVDKNGVRIFEGDTIKTWFVSCDAALVSYSDGCCQVHTPGCRVKTELRKYAPDCVEVIPNVYQKTKPLGQTTPEESEA